MLVKIIGCLLLTGSGVYLAVSLTRYERRRLTVLDGYLSLLRTVKGQIDCFARPLSDILAGAHPSVLAACRGQSYPPAGIPPGGKRIIPSLPALISDGHDYLTPESERILTSFADECGNTLRTEQVGLCEYCLEALNEERRRLADALPVRQRTSAALCLCVTAASVILLW